MANAEAASIARQRGQYIARIALAVALLALGIYILQGFVRALLWAGILAIAAGRLYARSRNRF
jgi:predicted PurR-regulated permease PerM